MYMSPVFFHFSQRAKIKVGKESDAMGKFVYRTSKPGSEPTSDLYVPLNPKLTHAASTNFTNKLPPPEPPSSLRRLPAPCYKPAALLEQTEREEY